MRKLFLIGPSQFSCGDPIPSIIIARIQQRLKEFVREKKAMTDEDLSTLSFVQCVEIVSNDFPEDFMVLMLSTLLRHDSGPELKLALEEEEGGQVESAMDFFMQSASGKIKTAAPKTHGSKDSNATRKRKG